MRSTKCFLSVLVIFLMLTVGFCFLPAKGARADVGDVNIVALGDSFTSGNAAGSYYDQSCYRSWNNYAHTYASILSGQGYNTDVHVAACNGATPSDVYGQVEASSSHLANADVVFLSLGGNPRFKDIVTTCLTPLAITNPSACSVRVQSAWDAIFSINGEVKSVIAQVQANTPPDTQIVIVGYPQLVASCEFDAFYGTSSSRYQVRQLVDAFKALQSQDANQMGSMIHYADTESLYAFCRDT